MSEYTFIRYQLYCPKAMHNVFVFKHKQIQMLAHLRTNARDLHVHIHIHSNYRHVHIIMLTGFIVAMYFCRMIASLSLGFSI